MTIQTLPTVNGMSIDYGSSIATKVRVKKVSFGDGYSQRMADGLNNQPGKLPGRFTNLTTAECNTLTAFFKARNGFEAFYYTPPGETVARLWTCEEWSVSYTDARNFGLAFTLEEQFTP